MSVSWGTRILGLLAYRQSRLGGPILALQRMRSFNDQQRFVLAIGAAVERVAEVPAVTVLARLDRVVLVETSYRTALDIRDTADVIIRIFDSEADARRAFELFQH